MRELPPGRQLAVEAGVSYVTARRALDKLVQQGVLTRLPNGRLEVNGPRSGRHLQIALMVPTSLTPWVEEYRVALEGLGERYRATIRSIFYMHWGDLSLLDAIDGFDGVFILPSVEPLPQDFDQKLARAKGIVSLELDLSHLGIPSVRLFPPVFVQRLLDHLEAQGHRRIDCFNVQPSNPIVSQRIEQWRIWMAGHGYTGELIDEPIQAYSDAFSAGHRVMSRILREGRPLGTAMLCITAPAAVGAMRAMHERGICPGEDVAICAVHGERYAGYQIPSLTSLEMPDATPYLATCLDWIAGECKRWVGPILVQPQEVLLSVRETTSRQREIRSIAPIHCNRMQ